MEFIEIAAERWIAVGSIIEVQRHEAGALLTVSRAKIEQLLVRPPHAGHLLQWFATRGIGPKPAEAEDGHFIDPLDKPALAPVKTAEEAAEDLRRLVTAKRYAKCKCGFNSSIRCKLCDEPVCELCQPVHACEKTTIGPQDVAPTSLITG